MPHTIADVAARSGVSTATVSRVLSGAAPARPETRERVLAAAAELGYRPSGVARALKRRETRTLGLVVTDITNPFYPQVVRAIEVAAHERGYGIILANGSDDPARELEHLDRLAEQRVDGIIIASSRLSRHHAARLRDTVIPVVLVNDPVTGSGLPSVTTDHRLGARMAAEHLAGLGHRRLGTVSAPREHAAAGLRLRGVREVAPSAVVVEGDGGVDGGTAAAEPLLAAGVTGVVAYNDLTAIGLLRGLRGRGVRVPADVSVIGFDDIPMAAWTDPPLTTVRQPTTELGAWATERVLAAIGGRPLPAGRVLLPPTLVVRGSSGRP